eukprot:180614-Rhodomonas_salina.1
MKLCGASGFPGQNNFVTVDTPGRVIATSPALFHCVYPGTPHAYPGMPPVRPREWIPVRTACPARPERVLFWNAVQSVDLPECL